jgi:hypothetical protein
VDVDAAHITSLLQAKPLQEYQVGGDKHANLLVHRITPAVAKDAEYIEWASRFDEKTEVRALLITMLKLLMLFFPRHSTSSRSPTTWMMR